MQRALMSWSAGKDSCLAWLRARKTGLRVEHLLTMFDSARDTSKSHGLPAHLLQAQAAAMGLTLSMPRSDWKGYERVFVAELSRLRAAGFTDVVFGDIDLAPHREWEEKVCAAAGMTPHLPLWNEDRARLADEILASGIEAKVVCVDSRFLGDAFCGRDYDRAFLDSLPAGVDRCGENGEFHTFVTCAPGFASRVECRVEGLEEFIAPAEYGGARYVFAKLS
jgi:uncharacterized protein (TIGR00290 family)